MPAAPKPVPLAPGTPAPPFTLPHSLKQSVSLIGQAGRPVVLIFYPADWSPVCGDELAIFNEIFPELESRFKAAVFGISVDGIWCHAAYASNKNLRFQLLADFHPKGKVSRLYNAYREDDGFSERALYVIDPQGVIFWSHISPIDVNPGADGVYDALERMQKRLSHGDGRAEGLR
jgi:peroxiredoxin